MDTDFPNNCSRSKRHVPGMRKKKTEKKNKKTVFGSHFGSANKDLFLNGS